MSPTSVINIDLVAKISSSQTDEKERKIRIFFKNGKLSAIFIEQGNSIESFVKWANRDITR